MDRDEDADADTSGVEDEEKADVELPGPTRYCTSVSVPFSEKTSAESV
jgi:hypothetical protein